jgi:cbb3-type cytochrome oxidase maturation protein
MYFPYFIAYMLVGVVIGLVVFLWALRNGQFKEQRRARFLPLKDIPTDSAPRVSRMNRLEGVVLMGLALAGVLMMASVLFVTLFKW